MHSTTFFLGHAGANKWYLNIAPWETHSHSLSEWADFYTTLDSISHIETPRRRNEMHAIYFI